MVHTSVFKVLQGDVIHRKEAHGGAVLRAHVSDSGPIGSRELRHTRPKELHELPADSCLTQMLRHKDQTVLFLEMPICKLTDDVVY